MLVVNAPAKRKDIKEELRLKNEERSLMPWYPILGLAAGLVFYVSFKETLKSKAYVAKKLANAKILPKGISMLLVAAQLTELVRVIEHATIVTVFAAAFLLAVAVASRSETEY